MGRFIEGTDRGHIEATRYFVLNDSVTFLPLDYIAKMSSRCKLSVRGNRGIVARDNYIVKINCGAPTLWIGGLRWSSERTLGHPVLTFARS
jgi:hypothetical protein